MVYLNYENNKNKMLNNYIIKEENRGSMLGKSFCTRILLYLVSTNDGCSKSLDLMTHLCMHRHPTTVVPFK
jgi:hypothetical protein